MAGIYVCPKCGHELFSAKAKYQHHTPWPAFTETIRADSVSKKDETEAQQSSKAKALKVHVCDWVHYLLLDLIGNQDKLRQFSVSLFHPSSATVKLCIIQLNYPTGYNYRMWIKRCQSASGH